MNKTDIQINQIMDIMQTQEDMVRSGKWQKLPRAYDDLFEEFMAIDLDKCSDETLERIIGFTAYTTVTPETVA